MTINQQNQKFSSTQTSIPSSAVVNKQVRLIIPDHILIWTSK